MIMRFILFRILHNFVIVITGWVIFLWGFFSLLSVALSFNTESSIYSICLLLLLLTVQFCHRKIKQYLKAERSKAPFREPNFWALFVKLTTHIKSEVWEFKKFSQISMVHSRPVGTLPLPADASTSCVH